MGYCTTFVWQGQGAHGSDCAKVLQLQQCLREEEGCHTLLHHVLACFMNTREGHRSEPTCQTVHLPNKQTVEESANWWGGHIIGSSVRSGHLVVEFSSRVIDVAWMGNHPRSYVAPHSRIRINEVFIDKHTRKGILSVACVLEVLTVYELTY
jgi:hypothetical protein